MATFWDRAAHSVGHNYYVLIVFCLFVILVITRLGFENGVWFFIAPVSVHCLLATFCNWTIGQSILKDVQYLVTTPND